MRRINRYDGRGLHVFPLLFIFGTMAVSRFSVTVGRRLNHAVVPFLFSHLLGVKNVGLKSNKNDRQFEKDHDEALKKLRKLIRDSESIKKTVENRLDKDAPEEIMTLLRELIPKAIIDLGQIYSFLNKYGYSDNVEKAQNRS